MASGYSRTPLLLKGALVELTSPFFVPIPNVVVFQYNPETLSRSLTPWPGPAKESQAPSANAGRNEPFSPAESISLTLVLDAADALETPDKHPVAAIAGVADRLAALEKLAYPVEESKKKGLQVDVSVSVGGASASASAGAAVSVTTLKTPVTLFVWGPGRIVPVKVTTFNVTEKLFNPLLYPVRAEVSLGLRVLTAHELDENGANGVAAKIAKAAITYTRAQQELLALANVANTVESIVGMLPV